jgi:CoA:oxalate CoA-transferase
VVLPHTPLIIHGADRVNTIASPDLGQHNKEIYSDWLGLSEAELETLRKEEVI